MIDECPVAVYQLHRRRIDTESKANSRRFCLGGKIICRTGNFVLNVQYCVLFPFNCVGGGGGGGTALCVDLYFKFKDSFHYFYLLFHLLE